MNFNNWPNSEFSDYKKEEKDLAIKKQQRRVERRKAVEAEKKLMEETKPKRAGLWSTLGNAIAAARDSLTYPKDIGKEPDEKASDKEPEIKDNTIRGTDVTYEVPKTARRVRVQIQDAKGRVKNQYTLTNYISINGGDRFRIIAD